MSTVRILAFAGATRVGSFNKKLIRVGADAARRAGADVTLVDLRDLPLPLYDGDLEDSDGLPPNGRRLKDLFLQHDAILLSCPEYNSSITAVLKNVFDWVSRPAPGEKPLECFKGKTCGLLAASPGALGGLRGLVVVRALTSHLGMLVLPEQFALSHADEAFDDSGALKEPRHLASVERVTGALVDVTGRLKA